MNKQRLEKYRVFVFLYLIIFAFSPKTSLISSNLFESV